MTARSNKWDTPDRLPIDHNSIDYNQFEDEIVLNCPNCCKAYLIRDLDYFLENRRVIWRLILAEVEDGFRKQKLIGSLAVCSAKETIMSQVEKNGFLTATCLLCMASVFKKFCFSKSTNFCVHRSIQ
jgi:hypothetical protein